MSEMRLEPKADDLLRRLWNVERLKNMGVTQAVYFTPQERLRQQADELDQKQALMKEIKDYLDGKQ